MKTIDAYKLDIMQFEKTKEDVENRLNYVLEKIKFLENIYMTGEKWNKFSRNFMDCAYIERETLCQESSACYSILREKYKAIK